MPVQVSEQVEISTYRWRKPYGGKLRKGTFIKAVEKLKKNTGFDV